ncbi:MAG: hypothetical protein O9301_00650 [Leptospira sp.]|nr:hypothetical protein [Leptospira sp.]
MSANKMPFLIRICLCLISFVCLSCDQIEFLNRQSNTSQNNLFALLLLGISANSSDDLARLNDEFNEQTLSNWNIYNNQTTNLSNPTTIAITNGNLQLTPQSQTLWFNAIQTGAMVSKTISGNFVASTSVQVRRRTNANLAPNQTVELAGLMVRNRDTSLENYVFIVLGFDENDLSVEVKTTTNDVSSYVGPSRSSSDGELRICRIGDNFYLYLKGTDGTWIAQNHPTTNNPVFVRSDLPNSLEVGLNIYANQGTPDVIARFDYIRFFRPNNQTDCTR